MIHEIKDRENCTVVIIPQDIANRVLETPALNGLYRCYSVEHPTGFTIGFGSGMEEM